MSEMTAVEERLAALERAVAELRARLDAVQRAYGLSALIGSVTDHDAFERALELGRKAARRGFH